MMTPKHSRSIVSAPSAAERTPLTGAVLGLLAAVGIALFFTGLPPAQTIGAGAVLILVFAFKGVVSAWEPGTGAETADDVPADRKVAAEETMSDILDELGDNYLIIHDVPCRLGNIDHVVLSEDYGVFLIERESAFDSRMRVDGNLAENNFDARVLRHSDWLVERLQAVAGVKAWVTPPVVLTDSAVMRSRSTEGITFTNMQCLVESMQKLGTPLPSGIWAAREKIASRLN